MAPAARALSLQLRMHSCPGKLSQEVQGGESYHLTLQRRPTASHETDCQVPYRCSWVPTRRSALQLSGALSCHARKQQSGPARLSPAEEPALGERTMVFEGAADAAQEGNINVNPTQSSARHILSEAVKVIPFPVPRCLGFSLGKWLWEGGFGIDRRQLRGY